MDAEVDADISTAGSQGMRSCLDVLRLSFRCDPLLRWLYPDATDYVQWFPKFVQRYGGLAFHHGTADCINAHTGVALWLKPGVGPNNHRLAELLEATVAREKLAQLWRAAEELREVTPVSPYWQLAFIGVDPPQQNVGLGAALLAYGLERCDADNRVAYVETTNQRNLSLYARHGFDLIDIVRLDTGPSIYAMSREPSDQSSEY